MWVGFLTTKISLSIGIVFILIYISAIAVVLVSVILVLGSTIIGSHFLDTFLLCTLAIFCLFLVQQNYMLVSFPFSISNIGIYSLAIDLLTNKFLLTILLSTYFLSVGLFITSSFFKSLYKKTNSGFRGINLTNYSSNKTLNFL